MRSHLVLIPLALLLGGCPGEPTIKFTDNDGDTFEAGDDCDDDDALIYPDAPEICDGIDNDCDDLVDMDDPDITSAPTWYLDADTDGYGDAASTAIACYQPTGYVAAGTDCDDTVATTHPGADEHCNGVDDGCSGTVDEAYAVDAPTWYLDYDSDGFGGASMTAVQCAAPSRYLADGSDCDDGDAAIFPGADEWCNGDDDDCDGTVDEDDALDAVTWYADVDGDGYGYSGWTDIACYAPSGFVGNDDDCRDSDAAIHPGAFDPQDGVDMDCDGYDWMSFASASAKLLGETADDRVSVTYGAGDVNADGFADILLGAGRDDDAGNDAGAIYLILGGGF